MCYIGRRVGVMKKKIKPRNFLVPVLRFKRPEIFLDKKKERLKCLCRKKVNIMS